MPIVDKLLIQYAVEGRRGGDHRHGFRDHRAAPSADRGPFRQGLRTGNRTGAQEQDEMLEPCARNLPKNINCIYIRQPEALGLGHAVLCAKAGDRRRTFAILLADDLLDANPPVMKQMTDVFDEHQCSVIGVQDVPRAETRSYGIVKSATSSERL